LTSIAVVGLGYVGLPLAVEFGKHFRTVGFDISERKLASLREGRDPSNETAAEALREARQLSFTSDPKALGSVDFVLVAVPTPVNEAHQPDFAPLIAASHTIGTHMRRGTTVIYESTVYPGATEEICIPELEAASGMKWKKDFHVAYSPERINPGDREHTLTRVRKVVAGDEPATLERVAQLYEAIVKAGVHRVSSIQVAEAAKVIENTQRDLNIALMNELAIIFNRLGLDTLEVLEAAGTKWNFLPFRPGLVGGHCIGVDPYYLTHKAERIGYHPQVILAGRRINDGMGKYLAEQAVKRMIAAGSAVKGAKINILGITFKEDCADVRNSKVADLIIELSAYGADVQVHDPVASAAEALAQFGVELKPWDELPPAEALIVAVAHREFFGFDIARFQEKLVPGGCFFDVKSRFDRNRLQAAGFQVWRL
jgi:UDP-N-acetyl-D-glucosamine/UDP-N-acetyl-D-galactosamine dehydrogenase